MKHNVASYNEMGKVHERMRRAHKRMKSAHKGDCGTNLFCTQGNIGIPS